MSHTIYFYLVDDKYGEFSNFAPYPVQLDGTSWPTTEHYFQAQKFAGTPHADEIRQVESPMTAARMGRDRQRPLRTDWEDVKDEIMRRALYAKYTQHPQLTELLLGTCDANIVEHTKNDPYWGDGGDGTGRNMLGHMLVELRSKLRNIG